MRERRYHAAGAMLLGGSCILLAVAPYLVPICWRSRSSSLAVWVLMARWARFGPFRRKLCRQEFRLCDGLRKCESQPRRLLCASHCGISE